MLAKRGPARQCRAQFLVLLKLWIQSISRVLLHALRFELLMGHLLSTKSVSKKVEGSRRIWCRDRETGGQRQLDDTRVPPLGRRLLSCSRGVRCAPRRPGRIAAPPAAWGLPDKRTRPALRWIRDPIPSVGSVCAHFSLRGYDDLVSSRDPGEASQRF